MDDHGTKRAPDYTNAAITAIGVNLLWILFVVWFVYGWVPVILLAVLINHFVDRVAYRRGVTPAFAAFLSRRRD